MERQVRRTLAALAAVALLGGCSSSVNKATSAASSALAAAQSEASALASAANGLTSSVASAEAAASSALANIKGSLDAKSDLTLGTAVTGSDGRTDVPVSVTNHGSQAYQYIVQINFNDQTGKLIDTVILNIPDVAANGTTQATARSNRALSGPVTVTVGSALKY